MKAIKIEVYGLVHGVYFRASTCQKAESLNIKGTVRNMPDGSVEVIAEGETEKLEQFVKWCQTGPRMAEVSDTKVTDIEVSGFNRFETLH